MTIKAAQPFHAPQIRTDTWPPGGIYWGLQPALLVFVYCAATGLAGPIGTIGGLLIAFVVLSIVEEVWPARRDWKQTLLSDGFVILRHPDLETATAMSADVAENLKLHAG